MQIMEALYILSLIVIEIMSFLSLFTLAMRIFSFAIECLIPRLPGDAPRIRNIPEKLIDNLILFGTLISIHSILAFQGVV